MNNIESFDQFINEEFIWSKYKNVVSKLYRYILTANLNTINDLRGWGNDGYEFTIKKGERREDDPYDEETWDEDIYIKINRTKITNKFAKMLGREKHPIYNYHLTVNKDDVKITDLEGRRLYRLIKNRKKNQRRDEERLRRMETKRRRRAEEIEKRERIDKTFKNL